MPGGLTYSTDSPTTNDNEFSLLAKLARAYGATPVPNDNESALLKKVLVAVNAGVVPEPPSFTLLGSFDLAEPGDIDTFTRAAAAGYTASGEADFQREAAVNVLRSAHFVDGVQCVLLETSPTPCSLEAPVLGVPSVDLLEVTIAFTPPVGSVDEVEYSWDATGTWASAGTSPLVVSGTAGSHTISFRAVTPSGVAGAVAVSDEFELVSGGGPDVWYDARAQGLANANRSGNASNQYWDDIVVAEGGTVTMFRWFCRDYFGGSEVVKMALYTNDGLTLLGEGSVTVNASGMFEFAPDAEFAITPGTYQCATSFNGGSAELGMQSTGGTYSSDNVANAYADFPPASLPAPDNTPAGGLCVGIFVS